RRDPLELLDLAGVEREPDDPLQLSHGGLLLVAALGGPSSILQTEPIAGSRHGLCPKTRLRPWVVASDATNHGRKARRDRRARRGNALPGLRAARSARARAQRAPRESSTAGTVLRTISRSVTSDQLST